MTTVETIPSAKKKIVLSERPPPKLRRWFQKHPRLFSAIALGLLVVLIGGIWRTRARGQQGLVSYHTVKRGDFPVSIIEGGALRAVNEVVVRNELEGMARIISIIAEGTQVKKGELLVQLDATDIQEKFNQQELICENSKFACVQGEQSLAIQKSLTESNIKDAELKVQFAVSDLEKYVEGEGPQARKKIEAAITLSQEDLKRAEDRYNWTVELNKKNYASKSDLEADSLAMKRVQVTIELAKGDLDMLDKYDFPKRKIQLAAQVEQAKGELDRLKQRSASAIAQAQADLDARKHLLELQNQRLKDLSDQLAATKLFAPQDGLVVYASTSASAGSPIEEGATVRLRQEIIKLPDISSMLVDVKVHETFVNQIQPGLLAYVTIDSQPEHRYIGSVRRVAPLPDTSSRYYNPNLKVYSTEVVIEEPIPDLKPGVSAHSEIVITNLTNTISVPIQAVTTVKGKQVVFLADGSTQVPVEVGFNNDRFIEIKSGLREGQQILLSAPITSSDSQDLVGSMVSSKEIEEAKDVLKKAHAPKKGRGAGKTSPKTAKPDSPKTQ